MAAVILSATPYMGAAQIPHDWHTFAECVLDRESGATLDDPTSGLRAKNPRSSASGRWQFLDNAWRHGLAHMVAERLHDHGMPWREAKAERKKLRAKPIRYWPAWAQDAGFAAVIDTPNGWKHWHLPGSPCNTLRARH